MAVSSFLFFYFLFWGTYVRTHTRSAYCQPVAVVVLVVVVVCCCCCCCCQDQLVLTYMIIIHHVFFALELCQRSRLMYWCKLKLRLYLFICSVNFSSRHYSQFFQSLHETHIHSFQNTFYFSKIENKDHSVNRQNIPSIQSILSMPSRNSDSFLSKQFLFSPLDKTVHSVTQAWAA